MDAAAPDAARVRSGTVTWTQEPFGAPNHEVRWGTRLVYDSHDDRFIMFGGYQYPIGGVSDETWSLSRDGNWTQLHPTGTAPIPRYCHCMAYIPTTHQVLIVNGRDENGPLTPNTAFILDLEGNRWQQIAPPIPPGSIGCSAHWVPSLGKVVVFGGARQSLYDESWAFDPTAQSFLNLDPPTHIGGRSDQISGVDPDTSKYYVFSGAVLVVPPYIFKHDFWTYDGSDWAPVHTSTQPADRRYSANGFDPIGHQLLIWGGTNDRVDYDDVWSFDPAVPKWTKLHAPNGPVGRGFSASVYDPVGDAILIVGGFDRNGNGYSDAWRLQLH